MLVFQTLCYEGKFDSSHKLPYHKGKCANLHGHTWNVMIKIEVMRRDTDTFAIIVDFGDLKKMVEEYDHKYLNDCGIENPTAEYLSYMFTQKALELVQKNENIENVRKITCKVNEGGSSYIETQINSPVIKTEPVGAVNDGHINC